MRFALTAGLALALLIPGGNAEAQLTKDQQGCVNALNRNLAKLASASGKELCACIKDAAKGKKEFDPTDPGHVPDLSLRGCVELDRKGKVAKAKVRTFADDLKKCAGNDKSGAPRRPALFANDPNAVNRAGMEKELALIAILFGSELGGPITEASGKDASKCQQSVAKSLKKCQDTKLKEFNKCKKAGLKDGSITDEVGLEACLGQDPKGKVAQACRLGSDGDPEVDKLSKALDKKCRGKGIDLCAAFSHCCPPCASTDLDCIHACLEEPVECEVCRALNVADGLNADCPCALFWPTRPPEEVGLDPNGLNAALDYLEESNTQGVAMIKDGFLVAERYLGGFTDETRHESFSVAKSFSGGLVGIAIEQGLLSGVDEKVCQFYDEWDCADPNDPRSRITLRHVMTLSTGLEWNEAFMGPTPDPFLMAISPSSPGYVLAKPSIAEPGTLFSFSTGDPALLTGVLESVTGRTAFEFARENIFEPIGVPDIQWSSDPAGQTTTYAGIQATVREFAAYGYLYLQGGRWGQQQIVPEAWVDLSTNTGPSLVPWYGYLWHVNLPERLGDPNLPTDGYFAQGLFGQYIFVLPSQALVIVRVANDGLTATGFDEATFLHLVLDAIVP